MVMAGLYLVRNWERISDEYRQLSCDEPHSQVLVMVMIDIALCMGNLTDKDKTSGLTTLHPRTLSREPSWLVVDMTCHISLANVRV